MSKSSEPGVGFEFPSYPVSWLKRDVLLFANSIGCTADELHFLYAPKTHPQSHHTGTPPSFQPFPTYPIILPFKHTSLDVIDFYERSASSAASIPGVPKLDTRRVVDGERKIEFRGGGKKFEVKSRVLGVYDKGKPGTVVETVQELVDERGRCPKTVNFPPPEGKKPDAVVEHQTTPTSAHLYRLNGDYNPLHATPEPGQKMGFGGAIMHGLYSWNVACHELLRTLGGSDPENIREFQARFASPVKPGDKLVIEMWQTGEEKGSGFEEVRFVVKVNGQKVCLSNGRAVMKCVGKKETKTSSKL
ncbi:hypothetical protein H2199_000233 [Coniosporium tulheliwenetii]|uniref:Uncharacterized protein n=1 Tax=Coniosporium tulheliwenetii TaxID=3383036 RepID=A0ACC2ZPK8_9PEZI|nr:hypothetical protein H2199_000233 [Cladosporium sp. JES 115]